MSGISTNESLAILDTRQGIGLSTHKSLKELAEHAVRMTWPEMTWRERVAWLRSQADDLEAEMLKDEAEFPPTTTGAGQ